jgi:hypothetical protein
MGANPSRTQTINSVDESMNHAMFNIRAYPLALQIDFMGTNQGSRSTPIYHSCKDATNIIYQSLKNTHGYV